MEPPRGLTHHAVDSEWSDPQTHGTLRSMTRSWVSFGFGVLLLATPLRLLWAHAGAPASGIFLVWTALVVIGALLARERHH